MFDINASCIANGYTKNGNLDIKDYFKIEKAMKLSEYEIYLDIWRPERKKIKPFEQWNTSHKNIVPIIHISFSIILYLLIFSHL